MRKRLLSILVACCMVLTMIPITVFATETEGPAAPAAAEGGALAEGLKGMGADLGEQLGEQLGEPQGQPEEQPGQPEEQPGQLEGQPEQQPTAEAQAEQGPAPQAAPLAGEPVVLNDEGENALANAAEKEVATVEELTAAIADSTVTTVRLAANIDFNGTLTVIRAVTLDLNGFTLKFTNPDQIPITTYGRSDSYTENYPIGILVDPWDDRSAHLTLADGSEAATGKLEMTGVDDNAIFVTDGELTMTGGTITNSYSGEINYATKMAGIAILRGKAAMTGGRIENQKQMGVWVCASTFMMGGNAVISGCGTAADTLSSVGGGVVTEGYGPGGTSEDPKPVFIMSGGSITGCKAADATDASGGRGGGVYMGSGCQLAMSGNARIAGCEAARSGSGIYGTNDAGNPWLVPLLTRSDNAQVDKGVSMDYALQVGSGIADFQTVRMDGLGTEAYPYEIGTADQLKLFRQIVNGAQTDNEAAVLPPQNTAACAVLTADIDLSGEAWTPIGNASDYFDNAKAYSGIFDGGGHTISGLNVTGNFEFAGLFGLISGATIQDLSISGSMTGSYHHFGSIAGTAKENSTIKNCSSHCNVTNTISGGYIGGVVGMVYLTATIIDCYNTGSINWDDSSTYNNRITGGIAGRNSGTICNCYNVGSISCNKQKWLGGIAGDNMLSDRSNGIIENCYFLNNTANVPAAGDGAVANTAPKTAEEFADGTVLKALIDGRADGEHPWDTEGCKFLNDDAEMELPVLAWQKLPATPTVNFDTDGGSEVESQSVRRGNAVQEPAAPTKSGYTFAGWCTDADRTEIYDFGTPVEGSFTLYAKWAAESYAIRYELDGGIVEGNPDSYTVETDAFTLNNPTKPGYIFIGWSGTGLAGESNMSVTVEKGSKGDRTYTAHWRYNGAEAGDGSQAGEGGSSQLGGSSSSPRTGDNSNVLLWGGLLLVSACGLASATILGRRRRTK